MPRKSAGGVQWTRHNRPDCPRRDGAVDSGRDPVKRGLTQSGPAKGAVQRTPAVRLSAQIDRPLRAQFFVRQPPMGRQATGRRLRWSA